MSVSGKHPRAGSVASNDYHFVNDQGGGTFCPKLGHNALSKHANN